jgi:hypothetical protein
MCELPSSGVDGNPTHGFDVIDNPFVNHAGGNGGIGSVGESVHDENESDGRDYEAEDENEVHGDDEPATIPACTTWWSLSEDDLDSGLHCNFDTSSVLIDSHSDDDDGCKWGEPVGRDPHMWGAITLSGAPDFLNGESLTGARLTCECCWEGDDVYVDVYEFMIDIEGGVYGSPLDHIRNHPECVRLIDQWGCPPADIVMRAIDAKRRRDLESLRGV